MTEHASTALDVIPAGALPVPDYSGVQMIEALRAWRELAGGLDTAMPDAVMTVPGTDRKHRRKPWWRAVGVAFTLDVDLVSETRIDDGTFDDGRPNFSYLVVYRATAKTGRTVVGDGACSAVEKAGKFKCPHPHPSWEGRSEHWPPEACPDYDPAFQWRALPAQATLHNVRSHAHSRAFNRAISNLCGFGDVSAEEVDPETGEVISETTTPAPRVAPSVAPRRTSAATISEPQRKRLWAIAKEAGWTDEQVKACLQHHGFAHDREVTRDHYDRICGQLDAGPDGGAR